MDAMKLELQPKMLNGKTHWAIFAGNDRQSNWFRTWNKANDVLKLLTSK